MRVYVLIYLGFTVSGINIQQEVIQVSLLSRL